MDRSLLALTYMGLLSVGFLLACGAADSEDPTKTSNEPSNMSGANSLNRYYGTAPIPHENIVMARQYHSIYEADEVAAAAQFYGRLVRVTGNVEGIGTDYVTLSTGTESEGVRCTFNQEAIATLASFKAGESISLLGYGDGRLKVRDCAPASSRACPDELISGGGFKADCFTDPNATKK